MEILILLLVIAGIGICVYIRHIKVRTPAENGAQDLILEAAAGNGGFSGSGAGGSAAQRGKLPGNHLCPTPTQRA